MLIRTTDLIRHDHQVPVSQAFGIGVDFAMFETEDLSYVTDLCVLQDLVETRISDVEKFSSQREDTIVVSTNDSQSRDGQCLGRVSFREDQGTSLGISPSSIVGIFQLDDSRDTRQSGLPSIGLP